MDERAVRQAVQPGLERLAQRCEAALNQLTTQYEGRPVEEVKRAVLAVAGRHAIRLPEAKATEFAQVLASGGEVKIHAKAL